VTALAQSKVLAYVMLPPSAADEVMHLKPPAAIGLRPPAHGTTAMLGHPSEEVSLLLLVHCC
jgi:hypothetical protein